MYIAPHFKYFLPSQHTKADHAVLSNFVDCHHAYIEREFGLSFRWSCKLVFTCSAMVTVCLIILQDVIDSGLLNLHGSELVALLW